MYSAQGFSQTYNTGSSRHHRRVLLDLHWPAELVFGNGCRCPVVTVLSLEPQLAEWGGRALGAACSLPWWRHPQCWRGCDDTAVILRQSCVADLPGDPLQNCCCLLGSPKEFWISGRRWALASLKTTDFLCDFLSIAIAVADWKANGHSRDPR